MSSPSSDLCLCLDKDRRSLYASSFAHKYIYKNKAKVIFHPFNYGIGLLELLKSISSKVRLPVSVLFQHPSPSPSSVSDLSQAISDCMKALSSSLISECIFVYDCHTSKSTGNWTNQRIQSLCKSNIPKATQKQIVLSNPHLISALKEEKVDHLREYSELTTS
jgi:hypothetical protein